MKLKYSIPNTKQEALEILHQEAPTIVAGGTDYVVGMNKYGMKDSHLLLLENIEELQQISENSEVQIGATVCFRDLEEWQSMPAYKALKEAAALVGSPQIRNRGTIGGNICTASPAADTVPALLVLDALVVLERYTECGMALRKIRLEDYLLGVKQTDRKPEELLTQICLPKLEGKSGFYKVGKRNALSIAIVNGAYYYEIQQGTVIKLQIAWGSVGKTARRCKKVETFLTGKTKTELEQEAVLQQATGLLLEEIDPITDLRGTRAYRIETAQNILRDMIQNLAKEME